LIHAPEKITISQQRHLCRHTNPEWQHEGCRYELRIGYVKENGQSNLPLKKITLPVSSERSLRISFF